MEVPLRQGDGDVLKGVQSPQLPAEGGPARPLVEVLVNAARRQAAGLLLNFGGHLPGVLAVAAGIEVSGAGELFKVPAEAGVDKPLIVEPQVQGAGVPQQDVAGHAAQEGRAEEILPLPGRAALEGREELRHGDLHGEAGLPPGHGLRLLPVVPGNLRPALPGQDAAGDVRDVNGVHVSHYGQYHVGGGVERPVAVVQRLRRDAGDALHRAGDGNGGGRAAVQRPHHPGV